MKHVTGAAMLWVVAAMLICADAWGEAATVAVTSGRDQPRIALIIDDLGYRPRNDARVVALAGPVACAVLPHSPYAVRVAERAHAADKEVLLHLPLQPVMQLETSAIGTIRIDTTKSQMLRILAINLAAIPYVVGVNNHQGSLLTQHPGHMNWLMGELRSRGDLFFVDSYTSESSVALRFAREHGVPSIRRDVFLDNVPTLAAIDEQFRQLKRVAASRGVAVGIGHPYTVTLEYLERAIPTLEAEGYKLIPVTAAILLGASPVLQTAAVDSSIVGR